MQWIHAMLITRWQHLLNWLQLDQFVGSFRRLQVIDSQGSDNELGLSTANWIGTFHVPLFTSTLPVICECNLMTLVNQMPQMRCTLRDFKDLLKKRLHQVILQFDQSGSGKSILAASTWGMSQRELWTAGGVGKPAADILCLCSLLTTAGVEQTVSNSKFLVVSRTTQFGNLVVLRYIWQSENGPDLSKIT